LFFLFITFYFFPLFVFYSFCNYTLLKDVVMEKAAYVYSRDGEDGDSRSKWSWGRGSKESTGKSTKNNSANATPKSTTPPAPFFANLSLYSTPTPIAVPKKDVFALAILPPAEAPNPRSPVCSCGE
jgi:hypothetical protein